MFIIAAFQCFVIVKLAKKVFKFITILYYKIKVLSKA